MFPCYSKEMGVGVLVAEGLHLQLFKVSFPYAQRLFLCFGVFLFCFVCFFNSHIGHKNQNTDSEFEGLLWVHRSRDDRFLACPLAPSSVQGILETVTHRWTLRALADEMLCSQLGLKIFLLFTKVLWVDPSVWSVLSYPLCLLSLFLDVSAVPSSRERGEGHWVTRGYFSSVLARS